MLNDVEVSISRDALDNPIVAALYELPLHYDGDQVRVGGAIEESL